MRKDKRCLDYQKLIKEAEAELRTLEKGQTKALLRDRVRFLRLLKSGECGSVAMAGRGIGLKLSASEKLWRKYREEGIEGLLDYPFKGYAGKLTQAQADRLEQTLHTTSLQSLHQGCSYVEKTFGVHYTRPGMHYVFERLKVKKKTARPTHHHKDEAGEKRFKKKDFPALKKRYHNCIYLEDEMRAGTRTECKQRWAAKGHRPVCKVKLGYSFTLPVRGHQSRHRTAPGPAASRHDQAVLFTVHGLL